MKRSKYMTNEEKAAAYDRIIERQHNAITKTTYQQRQMNILEETRMKELNNHLQHLSLQKKKLSFKLEQINKLINEYAQERLDIQRETFVKVN